MTDPEQLAKDLHEAGRRAPTATVNTEWDELYPDSRLRRCEEARRTQLSAEGIAELRAELEETKKILADRRREQGAQYLRLSIIKEIYK